MSKKKEISSEGVKARGFFRLQINEDGKVVGDSGWKQNQVTDLGFNHYLCLALAGAAGSKYVAYAALGTGTAPAAAGTALPGEITENASMRMSVATSTISNSKDVQFAFTLAASNRTDPYTIQNVGLFDASVTGAGTVFAGNTYTTSALASNQSVNGSYQIKFS